MLTLSEVLSDFALYAGFHDVMNVNIDSRAERGESPLHWMAKLGDRAGITVLINAGASVDSVDDKGNTPLHAAIISRQTDAASALIEHGADIHRKNDVGQTPLEVAKLESYAPILERLLGQE